MVIVELIVFVVFLASVLWLAWKSSAEVQEWRKAAIKKEQRQTQLYECLLKKLEEMEDGEAVT